MFQNFPTLNIAKNKPGKESCRNKKTFSNFDTKRETFSLVYDIASFMSVSDKTNKIYRNPH